MRRRREPKARRLAFRYDPESGVPRLEPELAFYRLADVAGLLGVSVRSVERWADAGLLGSVKPAQARFIEARSLLRMLEKNFHPPLES